MFVCLFNFPLYKIINLCTKLINKIDKISEGMPETQHNCISMEMFT